MEQQRYTLRYDYFKMKTGNEGEETVGSIEIKQQREARRK